VGPGKVVCWLLNVHTMKLTSQTGIENYRPDSLHDVELGNYETFSGDNNDDEINDVTQHYNIYRVQKS